VFENRVMRRILGYKRDEMVGSYRNLDNDKPHRLYSSPNIIGFIKLRKMKWTGNVA
jgi:hypothetical protein